MADLMIAKGEKDIVSRLHGQQEKKDIIKIGRPDGTRMKGSLNLVIDYNKILRSQFIILKTYFSRFLIYTQF